MKMNLGVVALTMGVLGVAVGSSTGCGDSGGAGGSGGTSSTNTSTTTSTTKATTTGAGMTTTTTTVGSTTSTGTALPTCAEYCMVVMQNCTGANADYANEAECLTACATVTTVGTANDTSGNTIGCHLYHAGAASSNAATHCPHADVPSTDNGGPGPCAP